MGSHRLVESTSPCLTILCDATLSHSLDLLGFYQPCMISSWDMTTCTTLPPPPFSPTSPPLWECTVRHDGSLVQPGCQRQQARANLPIFLSGMMNAQNCSDPTRCAQGAKEKKKKKATSRGDGDAAFVVLVCFNLSPSNLLLGSSRTTKARKPNLIF